MILTLQLPDNRHSNGSITTGALSEEGKIRQDHGLQQLGVQTYNTARIYQAYSNDNAKSGKEW